MYALLTSPGGLPIVISTNTIEYAHLICAEYQQLATGRKNEMHDKEAELLQELYGDIQQD